MVAKEKEKEIQENRKYRWIADKAKILRGERKKEKQERERDIGVVANKEQ